MIVVLSMLFRAKKLILFTFALVFGLVLVYLAIRHDKYQAHMSFLVRNERAEPLVGADPHQNSIQLPDVTEEIVNSEVELLGSAEVLRQVVLDAGLVKGAPGDQKMAIERATRNLSKSLTITPVRNSSVINVAYVAPNREQASAVLTQVAKVYLSKRMNLHAASQAESFFADQSQSTQNALKSVEDERAAFLSENGYEALPQQIQMSLQYVQDLKGQLDGAQAALRETEGRLRQISADRQSTPERIATQQRTSTNPSAIQQILTTLVTLENRRTELLTKFKPGDRQIVQMDQEIENTRRALARVETMTPQDTVSDANPAWEALDAEANRLNEAKAGMTKRRDQLAAQLEQQMARLRKMESDSVRVNELDRRVRMAGEKFDLYQGKAVAAKIADDLDAQHISNVVLASEPMVPVLPEPSRVNLLTGTLLALFVSLSVGFLSQVLSARLHGPSAVEQDAGVPVMVTLPDRMSAYPAMH